jgi:hypothetical protein
MAKKQKELIPQQQQMVQEELEAMRQRGEDVGLSASFAAMKKVHARVQAELKKERLDLNRKFGLSDAFDNKDAEDLFAELGTEQDMMPTIRPGDASIAAPFTSRQPFHQERCGSSPPGTLHAVVCTAATTDYDARVHDHCLHFFRAVAGRCT